MGKTPSTPDPQKLTISTGRPIFLVRIREIPSKSQLGSHTVKPWRYGREGSAAPPGY